MDVRAVDVGMLIDDVRLSAPAHSLHIFVSDVCQNLVRQRVFRVGVERDVDNGLLRSDVRRHPSENLCSCISDQETSVLGFQ